MRLENSFLRALVVGAVASLVSFGLLWLMVNELHFTPNAANIPSLAVGSLVQFLGNRFWVFRGGQGAVAIQLPQFAATEVVGFFLNSGVFYVLVVYLGVHYLIARVVATFAVFWAFNFQLWKRIFTRKS